MTVKLRQLIRVAGKSTPPVPPPVVTMHFIQQPQDTTVNELFLPPPSVQISDGASDSLTISSPTCDILPVTVIADSTGLALFVGLMAGPTPSPHCTLIVHNNTRPAVADITSAPFALTAVVPVNNLLQNLVSYYKFDETTGNAIDAHGSNDLTAVGPPGGGLAGIINTSRAFNGFTTYFIRDAPSGLNTFGESFTFQAWIFFTAIPSVSGVSRGVWSGSDVTLNEQHMLISRFTDAPIMYFYTTDGEFLVGVDFSPLTENRWYLIHAWSDRSTDTIGVSIDADINETELMTTTGTALTGIGNVFYVGTLPGAANLFQGRIDEMAFWRGRVLTQSDRTALWNDGNGLPYDAFD